MFAKQDEEALKSDLLISKGHVFTVKYQTIQIDDDVECMPVEISPQVYH